MAPVSPCWCGYEVGPQVDYTWQSFLLSGFLLLSICQTLPYTTALVYKPHFFSPTANSLTAYVCCYVLGEYFKVPSLPLESLAHVRELLTVQNALVLTQFAESIHSQALHDICVQFLQANQQQR